MFRDMTPPSILLAPHVTTVSPTLQFTLTVSDAKSPIKRVIVNAIRNERILPIIDKTYTDDEHIKQYTFTLKDTGLKDADFTLEIIVSDRSNAKFGFGNKNTLQLPMTIDSTPPRITTKTSMPGVTRGGTGVILYDVSKDVSQTGVKVGEMFFPAFRQKSGDFICYFAFPYFIETKDYAPQILAIDTAGNAQINNLSINKLHRNFKQDAIPITERFLEVKGPELEQILPGTMNTLERFIKVNSEERRANTAILMEIGKNTASEPLWSEAFMPLPRGATRARFAEHREYTWDGNVIDKQTHLGYDLASTRNAPVPAANSGRVVYTGYLGIYGNLVVIDHGLGLQSLYSHLSEITVKKDQMVQRGETIGKTGTTGIAFGDHLHFGILVAGLEVEPAEWLDSRWLYNNIITRIKDAGGEVPAFTAPAPRATQPATTSKPPSKPRKPRPRR